MEQERDALLNYVDAVITVMKRYRKQLCQATTTEALTHLRRQIYLDEVGRNDIKFSKDSPIDHETRLCDLENRLQGIQHSLSLGVRLNILEKQIDDLI